MFPIRKVDQTQAEDIEYLGTKRKFWFTEKNERFLFKAEERGTGEDWAEKVVSELAELLGLPHVNYELAHEYEGSKPIQPGVICPIFVPRPLILVLGNQLLYMRDSQYPTSEIKYGAKDHTISAVGSALRVLEPPRPEWMKKTPEGIKTAIGVFVGYVLLDAWVANQDRHHQNWGAILDVVSKHGNTLITLAPTFDHGASLARNLGDEERKSRLQTNDRNWKLEYFASRASSGFYQSKEDKKTLTTIKVFESFAALDPIAAKIWLAKLSGISSDEVDEVLAQVPPQRMSPMTNEFVSKLLSINQRRLMSYSH